MPNAVIYARYSPGPQQTEQSIEGQLRVCYDYALKNNITIIGEYADRRMTGKNDNRPEFKRMIADSGKGHFQIVLVYQLDRFSRNRYDSAVNKAILRKNGVKVVSARENISEDASGILMESVLEGMAEYYSAELAQKIRRGIEISASNHKYFGGSVPLGYYIDDNKDYQIDEQMAYYVVKIFEMYAAGYTMAQINEYLNQQQVKTARNNQFSRNSINKMLCNKKYIGTYTHKGIETPKAIPSIIPDDLFERVQKKMRKNKAAPARGKAIDDYILSGKLFCGHCQDLMTGTSGTSKTGKLYCYYQCNTTKKKQCKKKNVKKDYIEELVVGIAREQLTDGNISLIAKEVSELCKKDSDSPTLMRLQKLLNDNEKQRNNLLESLKIGTASETAANYVFQEIDKLEKAKTEIEMQISEELEHRCDLSEMEIKFFLTQLKKGNIDDIKYRKTLIAVFINSVYLYDDKMTVIFNASPKPMKTDISLINGLKPSDTESSFFASNSPA